MVGLPKLNETASRLLALLAAVRDEELHTNELIRRTDSNPNAVQRALTSLEASGIVGSRRVGNLRLWRMDRAHPLYAPVRDLVMRTSGIPVQLRALIGRDPGIRYAFLFGSFVTGHDDRASDIDLLVVGTANWDRLTRAIRSAGERVGRGLRPVVWSLDDLTNPSEAQRAFLENVLRDSVIWLIGDRDEFERHRSKAETLAGPRRARQRKRGRGQESVGRGVGQRRTRHAGAGRRRS